MSFSKLPVTFFVNSNSLNKMPFHEILQIWKCMYICVFRYLFHIPFSDFGGKYCQGKFVPMWVSDVLKHLSHHPLGKWKWYQRHWKERKNDAKQINLVVLFTHYPNWHQMRPHRIWNGIRDAHGKYQLTACRTKIYKALFDGVKTFDNFEEEKTFSTAA